jgi:hypothetical protein
MREMKAVQIEMTDSGYFDNEALQSYELEKVEDAGVDVIVYCYGNGGYEGAGEALLRKNGRWFYESLGHCSCYGPLDSLELSGDGETLDALAARMSEELLGNCARLFAAARAES